MKSPFILLKSLFLLGVLFVSTGLFAQQAGTAPAGTTPAPKPTPRAKTNEEFKEYSAAAVLTGSGAALEAAADNFAAKYPDSDLRAQLYMRAMHQYQTENQPAKIRAMAEKVLALDPENTVALVLTAAIISDQLPDVRPSGQSDQLIEAKPDQQAIDEVRKNAGLALQTIDSSPAPPNVTGEQLTAYRNTLKAIAHLALGVTNLKTGDDVAAETELKAATDIGKGRLDPYAWYHLTMAQEHQKKYKDALASATDGLRYAASDPDLTNLLQQERTKLNKLMKEAPAK